MTLEFMRYLQSLCKAMQRNTGKGGNVAILGNWRKAIFLLTLQVSLSNIMKHFEFDIDHKQITFINEQQENHCCRDL